MTIERPYHHGRLREAALEMARLMVEERGHQALSMRGLAARLEVAPSALYQHFKGRGALLVALADAMHGLRKRDLDAIVEMHDDPWEALEAAGRQFLDFAAREEAVFRMMYDEEVINAPEADEGMPMLRQSYQELLHLVRRALPQASLREARLRLIAWWSTIFGFACARSRGAFKPPMSAGLSAEAIEHSVLATALNRPAAPR